MVLVHLAAFDGPNPDLVMGEVQDGLSVYTVAPDSGKGRVCCLHCYLLLLVGELVQGEERLSHHLQVFEHLARAWKEQMADSKSDDSKSDDSNCELWIIKLGVQNVDPSGVAPEAAVIVASDPPQVPMLSWSTCARRPVNYFPVYGGMSVWKLTCFTLTHAYTCLHMLKHCSCLQWCR